LQWPEASALRLAQEAFDKLLPQGVATPNNHFFTICDPATPTGVGMIWFAVKQRESGKIAFVYDVLIKPKFQRMGYATSAFAALEKEASSRGLWGIALHVFGHNVAARALYDKLGYQPTNINMFKQVRSANA
jgi:ribosomal protein S18 acetylase RimI-like enzyme